MSDVTNNARVAKKPRFEMYDPVILRKNIKDKGLKKGDMGAVVEIWDGGAAVAYEVDFSEKRKLESILEKHLKLDEAALARSADRQNPISTKPPPMPAELSETKRP